MQTYKNTESGVSAYEFGKDYIITRFGNHYYLYSYRITGNKNVNRMKELAIIGKGLSGFISQNSKEL
jgi:hypothetical protein